jgi:hypothetical protein
VFFANLISTISSFILVFVIFSQNQKPPIDKCIPNETTAFKPQTLSAVFVLVMAAAAAAGDAPSEVPANAPTAPSSAISNT